MVSKCANPECSVPFRYLRSGKLFRMENEIAVAAVVTSEQDFAPPTARRDRFFWLCNDCSAKMTLVFEKGQVSTRPILRTRTASAGS